MSIINEAIYTALPTTTRGQPTQLSTDSKGERLAYASNRSIFIRSIDNPAQGTQYTQHTAPATVARFAPSGFYCASGDTSGTVRVWDCSPNGTGATKGEYPIISGRINDIAWDGDSQRIIAVGDGKSRYGACITADSGNSVGEITGHSAQANAVSIRHQRPIRAATASDDKNIVFYNGVPFKFNNIPGRGNHTNFIYGIAFSPDGNQLVSVGGDRKIWLYDGKTGEPKVQIGDGQDRHVGSIYSVSWSADSKKITTSSADRTVRIWDVEADKAIQTFQFGDEGSFDVNDHQVGVTWPAGRSDGLIISLSLNGQLNYLNEGTPKPTRTISGHQKNITACTLFTSSDSSTPPTLWTGSSDGRICKWDTTTGTAQPLDGEGHTNIVSGLASTHPTSSKSSHPTHPQLFSVGWDDTLRFTDISASTFTGTSTKLSSQPNALACTTDALVIVAQTDSVIAFLAGAEVGELPLSSSPTSVGTVGATAAIGAADSSLRVYAVLPDRAPRRICTVDRVSASALTAVSFSPDGKLLAVGDASGKIFVYGFDGSELALVTDRWSSAHTAKVTCLAWNEGSSHAVSGSLDTNIFVWSVKSPGTRVKAANAHKEGVNGVSWLGEKVLSCGADGAVKVWVTRDLK